MNHFFAAPTNEWNNNAVRLTPAGIFTVRSEERRVGKECL